jgi:hypothetical protein
MNYEELCARSSDINEHLPTLKLLASLCTSVVECGVREVVSSHAFIAGLPPTGTLTMIDPYRSERVAAFLRTTPQATFVQASDLECSLVETDLLFIDTWHVYGHLKRELARWHSSVRKYIALHDTEIDGLRGETLRNKWNPTQQSFETGIPVDEITKGLQPAIAEFLADHPEWTMLAHYRNNNGLTILARVHVEER